MALNTCALSGYLGSDAELISTASGYHVLSFSICVDMWQKGKDGNGELVPNWFDCVLFGKYGERIAPRLLKGTKVSLVGCLRQDKWVKDNTTHSRVKVVVDSIELLSSNNPGAQEPEQDSASYYSDSISLYDEDIPF
ncbi:single-stranded DNA-binding protein [Adlercreutzia agrestimuris]|uniref:single-stranded DNA-binding protein n=1 Tax=Adlercreutzia agrestimuris TaxID=2941324 RepID=UPI00203A91B7|nr:single-stranded DNA-binding protein [Adlercreutzia agrestimuris]